MNQTSSPYVLKVDRTNLANTGYTGSDKLSVAFQAALTGKTVVVGNANAPVVQTMYVAVFFGAAAELSDAQVKTLLTGLGWTIPWS